MYCVNCNNNGHSYKTCSKGIISNGIIAFYIENLENLNELKKNFKIDMEIDTENILYTNNEIKFLLIQRKTSLGYLEFMRGRYDEKDLNSINKLIRQMNEMEIELIKKDDFDSLWSSLWNCIGIGNLKYKNEYMNSKNKFLYLKEYYKNEDFDNSEYKQNEWGFPKGRREKYETNINCALREMEEETALNNDNFFVLNNVEQITEIMKGTNNIIYEHNYFLAYVHNFSNNNFNSTEVAQIKLCTMEECMERIRPYHLEKIKILQILYANIMQYLYKNKNQNHNEAKI